MFTGLIESVQPIISNTPIATGRRFCIDLGDLAEGAGHGDSICVNGACLTISQINGRQCYFDVMAETLDVTTLSDIKPGALVNLERAMPANGRFGGHIVQGHVDGIGTIDKIETDKGKHIIWIAAKPDIIDLLIKKGSVAIDGISLTIAELAKNRFSVSLIPTTINETNIKHGRVGAKVNLEADLISKWVRKRFDQILSPKQHGGDITMEKLRQQGFV